MTQWVVVVPQKSWTKCYGLFNSYDEAIEWVRANQWQPSDVNIYPVNDPVGAQEEPEK